jgi:hypothetical protein
MTHSRAALWQQLMALSPLCSGSLHEQYLRCGKPSCRCHDRKEPQRHGPYYLWIRRIGGKQVNRTLRPGPELERIREGVANYQKMQRLLAELLEEEESRVLAGERAVVGGSKKTSRGDVRKPKGGCWPS